MLAGFEIGSTKLAALATNAQTNSSGSGGVFAFFAAANTAGVSTTAVASLERNAVMTTPTQVHEHEQLRGELRAWLTASTATQSNRPSRRADFGQQHHAEQEQIDVGALADRFDREMHWQQAERDEQQRAGDGPHGFGPFERPHDDAGGGDRANAPGKKNGIHGLSTDKGLCWWLRKARGKLLLRGHKLPQRLVHGSHACLSAHAAHTVRHD